MHKFIDGIDYSPLEAEEFAYAKAGDFAKSWEKKQEFLRNAAASVSLLFCHIMLPLR